MNFLEIYFNGVLKQTIPINTDTFSIGRSSSNDVVINNMGVSSFHAVISKKNGLYYIEDLNSSNGTYLNSQKISSTERFNLEDSLVIGKHTLKLSEWSQAPSASSVASYQESSDATVIMAPGSMPSSTSVESQAEAITQKNCSLIVKGDLNGIKKLLLTENNYGIGKAKDNKIRIGGWFTPRHIAEIEKVGHSFYITPLKKKKVKLNNNLISSSSMLSHGDEIRIKKLFMKFSSE